VRPVVAITGANGYLGSILSVYFAEQGFDVLKLTREPDAQGLMFSLTEAQPSARQLQEQGARCVIHCAHEFEPLSLRRSLEINAGGTTRFMETCRQAGVERQLYISSMSAYHGCRSIYGRTKLAIEAEVERKGGISVRPGLIYSFPLGGMLGAVDRLLGLPVVPLIGTGRFTLYLIEARTLCKTLHRLLTIENWKDVPNPLTLAHPRPYPFSTILRVLARSRSLSPILVPIPWRLPWLALHAAERLGLRVRTRSDGITGLVYSDPSPRFSEDFLTRIGLDSGPDFETFVHGGTGKA
jgi:nucleoside-diphosphate-sugar epimerase